MHGQDSHKLKHAPLKTIRRGSAYRHISLMLQDEPIAQSQVIPVDSYPGNRPTRIASVE